MQAGEYIQLEQPGTLFSRDLQGVHKIPFTGLDQVAPVCGPHFTPQSIQHGVVEVLSMALGMTDGLLDGGERSVMLAIASTSMTPCCIDCGVKCGPHTGAT